MKLYQRVNERLCSHTKGKEIRQKWESERMGRRKWRSVHKLLVRRRVSEVRILNSNPRALCVREREFLGHGCFMLPPLDTGFPPLTYFGPECDLSLLSMLTVYMSIKSL